MAAGAGLSAPAPGLAWLALAQLVVGIGNGCVPPAMTALLSELAPVSARGRLLTLLQALWVVGILEAAVIGSLAVPRWGPSGAFLFGLIPLAYLPLIRRWLPESPRSLASRGRPEQAARLLAELERRGGEPLEWSAQQGSAADSRWGELLTAGLRRRSTCMGILWFSLVASYSGFLYWLPALLASSGLSLAWAYQLVVAISILQLPFVLATALIVDRIGRKWTVVPAMLLSGLCAVLLGRAGGAGEIVLLGAAFSASNLCGWAVMFAYTPEVFPTRLRARGVGWASAWGRVSSLLTPLAVGALLGTFGATRADIFLFFGLLLLLGALAVAWLGEETRGRTLEEISR